jgi:hypothetical protein
VNAADRFWGKVDKTADCWLWTAGQSGSGYGRFFYAGRQVQAHRWALESTHGPLPPGLQVDHLCRVRNCVRPDHLEVVSQRENILRGTSFSAVRARATRCVNGHDFDEVNTSVKPDGCRDCRACQRERKRARKLKAATIVAVAS